MGAVFVFADDPAGSDRSGTHSFETEIVLGRCPILLKIAPVTTGLDLEIDHAKAALESEQRRAAVLAGEVSLFEAGKLVGQARIDYLEKVAREGDAAAAAALGDMFDEGRGVRPDPARSAGYFLAGALGGRMDAAHNLAALYAKGRGVPLDLTTALAWLTVARERGDTSGADRQLRAHLVAGNRGGAVAVAEKRAADLRRKRSPQEIAAALPAPVPLVYVETADGDVATDAIVPETDAAEPEVVVVTSLGARLTWPTMADLERETRHGDATALDALGRLLVAGKRVPADPLRAVILLERSAALGNIDAAQQLGELYGSGDAGVRDDEKAFGYFVRAAEGGATAAMVNVGVYCANGRGTPRDFVKGMAWLAVAKKRGADFGQEKNLRAFLAQHRPDDLAKAEQLAADLAKVLPE